MYEHLQTDQVICHLIDWATAQESVRAVLITSTRAQPHPKTDRFSDYDIILVVRDVEPFNTERSWLNAFGEVLVSYWDSLHLDPTHSLPRGGNVIQFKGGLKIDFTLWSVALAQQIAAAPTLPDDLDDGYQILLDKDQLLAALSPPTYTVFIPTPSTEEFYQRWIEEFFSDAPYVAKCLWRDELLPAKWCLDYDMKHVYLHRFLEWRVQLDHNWSARTGSLGKGLKKQLPPDIWAHLERCFAGADLEENWVALLATMALFRRLAVEIGAQLGYTYPITLDQAVTAFVQQMQNTPRAASRETS